MEKFVQRIYRPALLELARLERIKRSRPHWERAPSGLSKARGNFGSILWIALRAGFRPHHVAVIHAEVAGKYGFRVEITAWATWFDHQILSRIWISDYSYALAEIKDWTPPGEEEEVEQ